MSFVARHPGGLDPRTADLARGRLPMVADAIDRFLTHLASDRAGPSPLEAEGISLVVTRTSRVEANASGMVCVRMLVGGRTVCGINAEGPVLRDLENLYAAARTIVDVAAHAVESAASHDGPAGDLRHRLFDHPAELIAAWRAAGTLARGDMVRVEGRPFERDIVRTNVVGETPLSPFAVHFDLKRAIGLDSDTHHVDPGCLGRLRLPGALNVVASTPGDGILVSLTPHVEEIVADDSDTMTVMRAEADLARYRSANP